MTIDNQRAAFETWLETGSNWAYISNRDDAFVIWQAALQSPEVQRLKAIEAIAEKILSIPSDGGYTVLTVHLDELCTAMEKKT